MMSKKTQNRLHNNPGSKPAYVPPSVQTYHYTQLMQQIGPVLAGGSLDPFEELNKPKSTNRTS